MQLKIGMFTGFCVLISAVAEAAVIAPSSYEITKKNLQAHVRFLSSDALEGRLTGSDGEKLATQYIANQFLQSGLIPAGDNGTFFQEFAFTAGVRLGKHNIFSITTQKGVTQQLILNQEWRPLAFSDTRSFENTELVFAGFGISAPALGKLSAYDAYQGLNVKNKWVVVFRYAPENISDAKRNQLSPYSSLRYKAFTAKTHGATGIIFVNSPDAKVPDELIPLSEDTLASGCGIIALSMQNKVLNDLFSQNNASHTPSSLTGIKMTGFIDIEKKIKHGRNVLAKLKVNPDATQVIVIGAHLDHLGHGELSGSRARDNEVGMIHAGADDNASGVASVLEAAAKLSDLKTHGLLHGNKDIVLAGWSGEEIGALGSSHFVKTFMKTPQKIRQRLVIDAAINLDMVGHLREKLVLQGIGSSLDWPRIINTTKIHHRLALITQSDPYLPTDSTSFYLHGVPSLNFFTGAHDDYHTPRDKADTLNYNGIKTISDFLVDLVLTLEKQPKQLGYHPVQKTRDYTEREFKIYLGTIPDYASADLVGVKLSGAAKNSPADRAGLKPGDVIIELAGKNIHDIYDYTFALNGMPVGKPVKLIALRGHTKIKLTIVARYRD
jgi:hypothetical protein